MTGPAEGQTYTLEQARHEIRRRDCAATRHAPVLELASPAEPVSVWLCDCNAVTYTPSTLPRGQHGPTADYGEG